MNITSTFPKYLLVMIVAVVFGCQSNQVKDNQGSQQQSADTTGSENKADTALVTTSSEGQVHSESSKSNASYSSGKIKMSNLLGINAFEWDFLQNPADPADGSKIYEPKLALIKSFGGVRHYMDWDKLEHREEQYTFNPTFKGGWNYDAIYERCKKEGIQVVSCLQNTPDWLSNTYPEKDRGAGNIPVIYGKNTEDPASYVAQGKVAFQFAARYGANKNVDTTLIKLYTRQRWTNDNVNTVKVGLDYIKYIECGNEPDKWWLGKNSQQNGRQYAANLSAFYDGHKGKLGKNVGVKTADPSMKVVMGGIARPDIKFVKDMIEWCKENRGYKKDGSVDLCFDVINFHMYSNDYTGWFAKFRSKKRGVAPETNDMGEIADGFVKLASELGNNIEVWTTETGYDLHEKSVQRAIPIGSKSVLLTQADWILRTSLMYARHGVNRIFFYQLFDTMDPGTNDGGTFGYSGLVEKTKRRPAADYLMQVKKLMGDYEYNETINKDPFVDVYKLGDKKMYALVVPDEEDRKKVYELDLKGAKTARIYYLKPGSDHAEAREKNTENGILRIEVSETPVFVQAK